VLNSPYDDMRCRACNVVFFVNPDRQNNLIDTEMAMKRIETLKKLPNFKKDIKALRMATVASKRAKTSFKQVLRERRRQFMDLHGPTIRALSTARREALVATKLCAERVAWSRAMAKAQGADTRLKRKYNLNHNECRALKISYWRRWSDRPSFILNRGFRVKI
jgi:translation initiation factor 2 alpha subunit (eIF-2alpha)